MFGCPMHSPFSRSNSAGRDQAVPLGFLEYRRLDPLAQRAVPLGYFPTKVRKRS
jgi:hypothetical protein